MEAEIDFIFLDPKSLWTMTADRKLKDTCSLERNLWPLKFIKKQRHHITNKGPYIQTYNFSSSQVWMWDLDHKEAEHCRIDVSNCGAGEDSWESLGHQGDQSSQFPKEINPEYSLEGQMLKLKLQSFGHLMWRTDSLEKTLMLGKIDSRWRRRGQDVMVV